MRIFVRTDASQRIGTGHVMRCLTLAASLRDRGAEVRFLCRTLVGNLIAAIRSAGFAVDELGGSLACAPGPQDPAHAAWLEAPWETDARESAAAIAARGGADWLVVDHYALDARWQRAAAAGSRVFVIDDIADREHACACLLDQNLYDAPEARYAARIPGDSALLLGPGYALLRPAFAAARGRLGPRDGRVRRVLVFFGGADPTGAALLAVEALSHPRFAALEADVVAGALNPRSDALRAACGRRPGTVFHAQAGDMAALMARADLALGAGGTSTWERCCLGLPSLTAWVADNQRELTETLARHGALIDLGPGLSLDVARIESALDACLADPERLAACSRLSLDLADGSGAERVAGFLFAKPGAAASVLRPAGPADLLTYFRWTNDPETRRQSFRPEAVPLAGHADWFRTRLADPATRLYVLEQAGVPAGQIRFQAQGGQAWIGFSVDPRFRGKGLGSLLLREGALRLRADPHWPKIPIAGAVKRGNAASHKAFAAAGYRRDREEKVGGEDSIIYLFPDTP